MQLSDTEKKMVARLRKRKQQFARWRWPLFFTGIFSIGVGIYCFVLLLRMFQLDSVAAAWAAFFSPVAYLFLSIGAYILTDTLMHWHGKPEVDLLLRLVEDAKDDAQQRGQSNAEDRMKSGGVMADLLNFVPHRKFFED